MPIHRHSVNNVLAALVAALLVGVAGEAAAAGPAVQWGSYLTPFSADSPWNARPVAPVFDDYEIPRSDYFPAVASGKYSTGAFLATDADKPVQVLPLPGRPGVWNPDAEAQQASIAVPRWPAQVIPASGSDGHADIVDPIAGVIHSFFKLKNIDGQWRAGQYAWTRLDGRGWGEPGHYFQGARAAAVPSMGGIIRKHEIDDGEDVYRHALAMSLTYNALSPNPTYIFPATSADSNAAKTNTGRIPEGALLMLPADFDMAQIRNERLRKVAQTLKVYGGYVVDRNVGTPFVIYVENGSAFNLHGGKWDKAVARELDLLRGGLRQVVKTAGWLDGNGKPMTMERRLNMLSMRGAWTLTRGARAGAYDSLQQAVVFAAGVGPVVQINYSSRILQPVRWALPKVGEQYRLTARTTGGGRLRLQLFAGAASNKVFDSGELEDGQSVVFEWPTSPLRTALIASSGSGEQAASVGGSLIPVAAPRDDEAR